MKKMYFTRHGETEWNVSNKICGATESVLTERGHEQAIELGERLKAMLEAGEIRIDRILCSPLQRARNTAEHIAEITGLPLEVKQGLYEQNFGKYEGTPRNGEEFRGDKANFCYSFEGGESMMRVAQRVYNILDEIREDDLVYLLVAHNGLARIVRSYFCDMTNDEFAGYGIHNCELVEFDLPGKEE